MASRLADGAVVRRLHAAGVELAVEAAGDPDSSAPPLVLAHGLTATRRYVVHGSKLLQRSGYHVISYDARGHGESNPAPDRTAYAYADLVADLGRLLDELELERVVLAGASMGAATTLAFALEQPERVAALVQITPAHLGLPADRRAELARWDALADGLERDGPEGFLRVYGEPPVEPRFRKLVLEAIRQRLERHVNPAAVADAIRVVVRSKAFDGVPAPGAGLGPDPRGRPAATSWTPSTPMRWPQALRRAHRGSRAGVGGARRVAPGMARGRPVPRDRRLPEANGVGGRCLISAIQSGLRAPCASRLAEHMFCPGPAVPCEPMFYRPNRAQLKAQLEERLRTALDFATLGAYEPRARRRLPSRSDAPREAPQTASVPVREGVPALPAQPRPPQRHATQRERTRPSTGVAAGGRWSGRGGAAAGHAAVVR